MRTRPGSLLEVGLPLRAMRHCENAAPAHCSEEGPAGIVRLCWIPLRGRAASESDLGQVRIAGSLLHRGTSWHCASCQFSRRSNPCGPWVAPAGGSTHGGVLLGAETPHPQDCPCPSHNYPSSAIEWRLSREDGDVCLRSCHLICIELRV